MALDIDKIVEKAYTGTVLATEAELVPSLLSAELELPLRNGEVLQQSVLHNEELLGTPGDEVYIPRITDAGTVSALTEGTDIPIISLDAADSVLFTPSEVGLAFGITRKALDRIKYDSIAIIVSQLAYAMTKYLETNIAKIYQGAVTGHAGEKVAQVYPNAHDKNSVVSTDKLDDDLILEAVTQLEEDSNIPFEDGFWRLYISPRQYKSLIQDDQIRNDLHFASPEVILRGEVGMLHNCRIVKTNWIQRETENTVAVDKALLLAPRWAAIAWKRRPEVVLDPTLLDFGRRRQFAVMADLQMGLLHAERAKVLATAR